MLRQFPSSLSRLIPASSWRRWVWACLFAPALLSAAESGQDAVSLNLRPSRVLGASGKSVSKPALVLSADRLSIPIDQTATAQGDAELRFGELLLRAGNVSYDPGNDRAHAQGNVSISRAGSVFRGPELTLYVNRFAGEFLRPTYFFSLTGGGGKADKITFIDADHLRADGASYSSCPVDQDQQPAWQISAKKLNMDFERNEGVASGAVLHFQGLPILAAPALSFPLGGQRKSGWLPPNISLDNRSGVELGLPYYWNLAPQRDVTLTPFLMSKRGAGLDSEFRYLEAAHAGKINLNLLPGDRVADRSRWALNLLQDGDAGADWRYRMRAERVSDDNYWKDMPGRMQSQTQRLLAGDFQLNRRQDLSWGELQTYARVQHWQALQGTDPSARFLTPYQRSPQVGMRVTSAADAALLEGFQPWGRSARLEGALELEYNRFDLSPDALQSQMQTGQRLHLLGHLSLPLGGPAWWLVPSLAVNAASYTLDQQQADGRRSMGRVLPTFSVDHGWVFERDTQMFGMKLRQTVEPRFLYINTPYVAQQNLPNFDAAPKDFNFDSVYAGNQFSGVDRVSDANKLTVGATSRWVNPEKGEELLRLGLVQQFLFRDQRITPDGVPVTQKVSDLLLLGAVQLDKQWWADGTLEYNPETGRMVRNVSRLRYSPGSFRTVSLAYRLAAGQSEQVELAWQWPLTRQEAGRNRGSCSGAWYSAGRLQYSLRDARLTDSVLGFEYDAGCWLLRFGAERLSTGLAETNTRLMLQLELVGLSQLGSNALKVLRDNIPGYRQLSSDRSASTQAPYD